MPGIRNNRWFLAATTAAAFIVRVLPYRNAFLGGNIIFHQPDAYSHLRRATLIVKNFPAFPTIDHYMAYPYGAEAPWPPLYDYLIGFLSMLFGLGSPGDTVILVVTTLLPPVLGALTVIPVFLVARHLFGERVASWAAVFAVVMPGQLSYSVIGSGDHHTADAFLLLWVFHYYLKSRKGPDRPVAWLPRKEELLAGLFLGLGVLVWQGSIVYGTMIAAYACLHMLLLRFAPHWCGKDDPSVSPAGVTWMLLVAALMTSVARAIIPPGTEQGVFDFGFFSWFQPLYLVATAVPPWILWLVLRKGSPRKAVWAALLAAAAAAALFLFPGVGRNILEGIRFLLKKHPYLASIDEFQHLFMGSPLNEIFRGNFGAAQLWEMVFVAGLFLPLLPLARIWRERKDRGWGSVEIFFALWTLAFLALTLLQKRWANVYGINVAIGVGWTFSSVLEKSRTLTSAWREFLEWRESRSAGSAPRSFWARVFLFWGRAPWAMAAAAFFVFLVPYQRLLYSYVAVPGLPIDADHYNSLIWMRLNTPKTSHLHSPGKQPEYSVLAQWDVGHWIQYISERPTVVNNYGYQLRGDGLGDSIRFFLAKGEEEAFAICRKRGVRFVFANDVFGPMMDLGKVVGVDFEKEYAVAAGSPHPGVPGIIGPNDRYYALFYQRMYYFDGRMAEGEPALTHFRLIFESKMPIGLPFAQPDTKKVKIYEVVEGARLEGTGPADTFVTAAVRLQTNFGRLFEFVSGTQSDAKGRFSFRIPYASADNNYFVSPVSRFLVIAGDRAQFVDLTDRDVLEGRTVRVDLQRRGYPLGKHKRTTEGDAAGDASSGRLDKRGSGGM